MFARCNVVIVHSISWKYVIIVQIDYVTVKDYVEIDYQVVGIDYKP